MKKGKRHAKGSKGFRVDKKNDETIFEVLFTGPSKLSPLRTDKNSSPGGLEPPTFQLTAECANRLRHGGLLLLNSSKIILIPVRQHMQSSLVTLATIV